MLSEDFKTVLTERKEEVNNYIELVRKHLAIIPTEPTHINILYSNTYLILYNYIESTISGLLNELSNAIKASGKLPYDFTNNIKKEWVRFLFNNKQPHTFPDEVCKIIDFFKENSSVNLKILKGGGGNFDDEKIFDLLKKLGIKAKLSGNVMKAIKKIKHKTYQNDDSVIKEIVRSRNQLAHGELPSSQLGKDKSIDYFEELTQSTILYIDEIVSIFENFIKNKDFLIQDMS